MLRHVAGIAEVVEDLAEAIAFYRDRLGLEVELMEGGEGYAMVAIPGVAHYGLWERSAAAAAILGDASRAAEVPLGITVSLEVDEVDAAAEHIGASVHGPQDEEWGQRTARFWGVSGTVFEVAETPWARTLNQTDETPEA